MTNNVNDDGEDRTIQAKWGVGLAPGFTVVPWVLLRRQAELGVDSDEMLVLLHLIASWWHVDELPFPRTSTIASRMQISTRTVQRALQRLEAKNLVKRVQGVGRNSESITKYDLNGLVARLKELALIPLGKSPAEAPEQAPAAAGEHALRVVPNYSFMSPPAARNAQLPVAGP